MKYSDSLVAEMREIGSFTYTSANAFADARGISRASFRSKLNALQIPYQGKTSDKPSARVLAARTKAEIVASIQGHVGFTLDSLSKMTVADLELLELRVSR